MYDILTENNINLVEEAINDNKIIRYESYPCISYRDYENAELMWNLISANNVPITSYLKFASNSYGLISYGYYKAKNGNIYIVEAYINHITNIYIPSENIDCIKNVFNNNNNNKNNANSPTLNVAIN